jgi:hypothetical protein
VQLCQAIKLLSYMPFNYRMTNIKSPHIQHAKSTLKTWVQALGYVIIALFVVLFVACDSDESILDAGTETMAPRYHGFVLISQGEELARIYNGKQTGKVFIAPNEVIPLLTVTFLDINGEIIISPDESVIVKMTVEHPDRVSVSPTVLPDNNSGWNIRLDGLRPGVVELGFECIPGSICNESSIEIQVVG